MLSLPGYSIIAELHASSKTLIYRACRDADQVPVILKTLADDYPPALDAAILQHEYALTCRLRETGLLHSYALEKQRHRPVLVQQDIGGISLDRFLARAPLKVEDFLPLALGFARALGRLHQQHLIHKDINPANLVLNPATGQIQIIDFGIATALSRENPGLQNPGLLEGTLAYLSPEQTGRMNRVLDYRSDFYSLGATFYEMLTGTPPFASSDPMELVHCHLAKPPPPLEQLRPDIAPLLAAVVHKLLAKTAEARYQSAFGLCADLQACAAQLSPSSGSAASMPAAPAVPGQHDVSEQFHLSQKLYGREPQVQALLDSFARVSAGASEMLLVSGYSGVGKSALVHEVLKPMTQKRGYFIKGKFDQFQRDTPYASLIAAFGQLVQQLLTESSSRILRWQALLAAALGANASVIIDVMPEVALLLGNPTDATGPDAVPGVAAEAPNLAAPHQPAIPAPSVPSAPPTLPAQEAANRFHATFARFIAVFARPEHPLVLFLDDLQWADPASLHLLEDLLTKSRQQCLLVLGAYRDNEVHASHPLLLMQQSLQRAGVRLTKLPLAPLDSGDLARLIGDTLTPSAAPIAPLADLVWRKTGGNPFFVNAFLTRLYEEGQLRCQLDAGGWQWDMAQIEAQQITDNVVELMQQKLATLPPATQHLLLQAACIGHQFDLATLCGIASGAANPAPATPLQQLWPALDADLVQVLDGVAIEPALMPGAAGAGRYRFRFVHDRVQQAAYQLRPASERAHLHLAIGRLWLAQRNLPQPNHVSNHSSHNLSHNLSHTQPQHDESLFAILNQFQAASSLIDDPAERGQLAQLHLEAGRKAMAAIAFASALHYLGSGLAWLHGGDWQHRYALTLALSLELAECEFINHHHDLAEHHFQTCLLHAKTAQEQAQIHLQRMQLYGNLGDYSRAVDEGLAALRLLGIRLPRRPRKVHLLFALLQERWARRAGPVKARLDRLPEAQDERVRLLIRIFSALPPYASFVNLPLTALVSARAVQFLYRHGVTADAAYILMTFAATMIPMRRYRLAKDYADKALAMGQNQPASLRVMPLHMYANWILHWFEPLHNSIGHFEQCLKLSLETGNWSYASFAMVNQLHAMASSGQHLPEFLQYSKECDARFEQMNDPNRIRSFCGFCQGWAAALLGQPDALALAQVVAQSSDGTPNHAIRYFIAILACQYEFMLGNYPAADAYLQQARRYLFDAVGMQIASDYPFLKILLALAQWQAACESAPNRTAPPLPLKELNKNLHRLAQWASQCPENFGHKHALAQAEMAAAQGQFEPAQNYYEQACEMARQNGFIQHQALASECAMRFYLRRGKPHFANWYREQAEACYADWGAAAKVWQMQAGVPGGIERDSARGTASHGLIDASPAELPAPRRRSTSDGIDTHSMSSALLDLGTVMKATQAISGQIVLAQLLEQLLRFAIENAGAERGVLVLETGGKWQIEVQGAVTGERVQVSQTPIMLDVLNTPTGAPAEPDGEPNGESNAEPPLPVSLIQYVLRSQHALLLDHACASGSFTTDAYIARHQVKSALCAPILHHGKLAALLYLENNLSQAVFTADRLAVLKILAAQAAISIENARVYEHLEATVAQRTAALQQSNQALAEAVGVAEHARQQAELAEQQATGALAELRTAQGHLVQSAKMASLGHLVAGVAHELNTPIGNALTTASTLGQSSEAFRQATEQGTLRRSTVQNFTADARHMSQVILEACQRAALLINQFKQVAVDQTSEQRRRFDLRELVEGNVAALRASYPNAAWQIEINIPDGIICDSYPGPLGQIIAHMVQNADLHAFANRSQGLLRIVARAVGDHIDMCFEDDGPGIDSAVMPHIFEPFFSTLPTQTQSGPGLGLSISLNIASGILGGTLAALPAAATLADANRGVTTLAGARFHLCFPLVAPEQTAESG